MVVNKIVDVTDDIREDGNKVKAGIIETLTDVTFIGGIIIAGLWLVSIVKGIIGKIVRR